MIDIFEMVTFLFALIGIEQQIYYLNQQKYLCLNAAEKFSELFFKLFFLRLSENVCLVTVEAS